MKNLLSFLILLTLCSCTNDDINWMLMSPADKDIYRAKSVFRIPGSSIFVIESPLEESNSNPIIAKDDIYLKISVRCTSKSVQPVAILNEEEVSLFWEKPKKEISFSQKEKNVLIRHFCS